MGLALNEEPKGFMRVLWQGGEGLFMFWSALFAVLLTIISPHLFGYCVNTAPGNATQFGASIAVSAAEPAAAAEYAWVMAEASGTMFTEVGWVWFATGTPWVVNGGPVPTGAPYLFAYTTVDQGNGDNCGAGGTFTIGPALRPGSSLTGDIARSGTWYGDEALISGSWTMVQTATLTGTPTWMTSSESWGSYPGVLQPTAVLRQRLAVTSFGMPRLRERARPAPGPGPNAPVTSVGGPSQREAASFLAAVVAIAAAKASTGAGDLAKAMMPAHNGVGAPVPGPGPG